MSDERIPAGVIIVKTPRFQGKKNVKIELFKAAQWQRKYRPFKKNVTPRPPVMDHDQVYWAQRYRLRVDGRWHGSAGFKYTFFTLDEILQLAGERLATLMAE
jgi:hypothetical protein